MAGDLREEERWAELVDLEDRLPGTVPEGKEAMVDLLEAAGNFRDAAKLARSLGLEQRSKKLWIADSEAAIRNAIKTGNPIAATFRAAKHPAAKRLFLETAVAEGMLDLARERAAAWDLPLEVGAEAEGLREQRRARHYCILSTVQVEMVEEEAAVERAFEVLGSAPAVGLDVECSMFGEPALLQLATKERAFLVDLLRLGRSEALGSAIASLLADETTTKLVFGGPGDLKVLGKLQGLRACNAGDCTPCVDLQKAAKEAAGVKQTPSLSKLTEEHLGKPLDKSMQASDWTGRPLREGQRHYAALDAWVLTQLYERLVAAAS